MVPTKIQFRESRAEVEMFGYLRHDVSNDFTALHHVPWASPDSKRRTIEGEADFVIVHPELGALVLEVKGGTLRFNADSSLWYQTSIGKDDEHPCVNPFGQASNGARAILKFLESYKGWRRNWGPIGFGVCFPDGAFESDPTPAIRPELVIDGRHLREPGSLEKRLRDVMGWYPRNQFVQGFSGAKKLVSALNHDVAIEQPLGLRVEGVDRAISELSQQQYRIIRYLKHKKRLAISGPAGSGKTLLALERAREAARSGMATLLLTYNRPLADHLSQQTSGLDELEVCNFHQLCHRLAGKAGLALPSREDEFFAQAPSIALDALDKLGGQYDAVVVDEGQVMEDDWWVPIEASLKDPDNGLLWVFYDDNQALYQRPRGLPTGVETQPLTESWRNSRQIFDVVMRYYEGDPVDCLGPDGPEVDFVSVNGDLRRALSGVLHRLVKEQAVRVSDIVVLTPRSAAQSGVAGEIGAFRVNEAPTRPTDVRLSSIKRFLGLEAQVVIVCELPDVEHPDYRSLMYVGLSRARSLLVVLGESE